MARPTAHPKKSPSSSSHKRGVSPKQLKNSPLAGKRKREDKRDSTSSPSRGAHGRKVKALDISQHSVNTVSAREKEIETNPGSLFIENDQFTQNFDNQEVVEGSQPDEYGELGAESPGTGWEVGPALHEHGEAPRFLAHQTSSNVPVINDPVQKNHITSIGENIQQPNVKGRDEYGVSDSSTESDSESEPEEEIRAQAIKKLHTCVIELEDSYKRVHRRFEHSQRVYDKERRRNAGVKRAVWETSQKIRYLEGRLLAMQAKLEKAESEQAATEERYQNLVQRLVAITPHRTQ